MQGKPHYVLYPWEAQAAIKYKNNYYKPHFIQSLIHNKNMKKTNYQKTTMRLFKLKHQARLLVSSQVDNTGVQAYTYTEYDEE